MTGGLEQKRERKTAAKRRRAGGTGNSFQEETSYGVKGDHRLQTWSQETKQLLSINADDSDGKPIPGFGPQVDWLVFLPSFFFFQLST